MTEAVKHFATPNEAIGYVVEHRLPKAEAVPIFEEFQEVPALFVGQGDYSPVIQGDQIGFRQGGQELGIPAIELFDFGQNQTRFGPPVRIW